jgi:PAS domain S-box-containing protein
MNAYEGLFFAAFESSAAATAIYNLDTTIAMVNDAYCKVSGYTRDEVIGMSWMQQIPPDDIDRLVAYNKTRLIDPASAPSEYEFSFYTKQGVRKHGLMFVKLIPEYSQIICSFVDISERKKADTTIAKQKEELQQYVKKQLNDLAQQALLVAGYIDQNKRLMGHLHKLRQLDVLAPTDLNELIRELTTQQGQSTWSTLSEHIENLQPDFTRNLLVKHPDLTPSEIKLANLLHLNVDTKTIASLTSQTYDSIRVARTRLRKKIKLGNNDSLTSYLLQF